MNNFNGSDGYSTLRSRLASTNKLNNKKTQKIKNENLSNTKDYNKWLQTFFMEKNSN